MTTARPLPQPGVLALGTSAQVFLELDLEPGADPQAARAAMGEICEVLADMLTRMAGADGGPRDELTRYTTALTGASYVLPAATAL